VSFCYLLSFCFPVTLSLQQGEETFVISSSCFLFLSWELWVHSKKRTQGILVLYILVTHIKASAPCNPRNLFLRRDITRSSHSVIGQHQDEAFESPRAHVLSFPGGTEIAWVETDSVNQRVGRLLYWTLSERFFFHLFLKKLVAWVKVDKKSTFNTHTD
jgi:hypothetical protein